MALKPENERFIEAFNYLVDQQKIRNKSDLARRLGVLPQIIYDIFKSKIKPSSEILENIQKQFAISKSYIAFGEGDVMLKNVNEKHPINNDDENNYIRLLPISASGGSLTDFVMTIKDSDCEKITSPIRDVDFAITVTGHSMEPEYPAGSQILIKKIDEKQFIEWGRCYVLDTTNGVVIKKLIRGEPGFYHCISVHPDQSKYAPFDIPEGAVFGIYRVLMIMSMK